MGLALHSWLHLEPAAHAVIVRPIVRVAAMAARLDGRLIAAVPTNVGRLTVRAGRLLVGLESRALSGAVTRVAAGTLRTARATARGDVGVVRVVQAVATGAQGGGRAVRRTSSSGQLHRYYLQLIGGFLAVLVIVSVIVVVESSR